MAVEQKRLAVVGPQRLVDAFAVEKPVVEHRDDGVLLIGDAAVDVDHRAHVQEYTLGIQWTQRPNSYDKMLFVFGPFGSVRRCGERSSDRMRVLNSAQMREADRRTIEEIGIPSLVLMENAGRQVVAAIEAVHGDLLEGRVAVLCGRGNNGGDGFVVARTLLQRGVDVSVFLIGRVADVRGDARVNLEILGRLGLTIVEIADSQAWELHFSEISDCTLIVDAIFGTGLNAPLSGLLETVVADVNASGIPIVADRSAVGAVGRLARADRRFDRSRHDGHARRAEAAAGAAAGRNARRRHRHRRHRHSRPTCIEQLDGPRVELLTRARMRELITPRAADSHKGDYGHVLIVAGSRGKTGAAHLAGDRRAAVGRRPGDGRDRRTCCQPMVAAMAPEYMTEGDRRNAGWPGPRMPSIACWISPATSSRSGPGSARRQDTARVRPRRSFDRATMPLVIDADGLNAFADDPDRLRGREGRDVIITPHPGEMARLVGMSTDEVQASRLEIARNFAVAQHVYVVLKGHRTLIATPDEKVFINPTGNAGMATGGTGDVLTGMIAAWLAQLLDAEAACKLAVYLHGMAGDLAEADEGEVAMTAGDLAGHLGDAILELTARRKVVEKS